jgi:hypothetical protein
MHPVKKAITDPKVSHEYMEVFIGWLLTYSAVNKKSSPVLQRIRIMPKRYLRLMVESF